MLIIHAEYRKSIGTGHCRRLRIKNKFPAIVYGKNKKNLPITINQNELSNIKKINELENNTIKLNIQNVEYIVKIYNIQYHPFKNKIIHIDFLYDS